MDGCLFCKIAAGEIPSSKVYENEFCFAFRDINPQAKTHVLVIPKQHVANARECPEELAGKVLAACGEVAKIEKLDGGFRLVSNCGKDACQSVNHFHVHVLGGEQLNDKMA